LKQAPRHGYGFLPVFLLTLVLLQGMGWFLAWQGVQWQAKIAAHKALFRENTAFVAVTLTQNHFQKIKADKREVRLNGNLYDIRSSSIAGDSIHLVLYHDKREQALYDLLGVHFSQLDNAATGKPNPVSFLVAQWLGAAFLPPDAIVLPIIVLRQKKAAFHWGHPHTEGIHLLPFIPPRMA
jgi:hypothetical protein